MLFIKKTTILLVGQAALSPAAPACFTLNWEHKAGDESLHCFPSNPPDHKLLCTELWEFSEL